MKQNQDVFVNAIVAGLVDKIYGWVFGGCGLCMSFVDVVGRRRCVGGHFFVEENSTDATCSGHQLKRKILFEKGGARRRHRERRDFSYRLREPGPQLAGGLGGLLRAISAWKPRQGKTAPAGL